MVEAFVLTLMPFTPTRLEVCGTCIWIVEAEAPSVIAPTPDRLYEDIAIVVLDV
jgi:hypothetical protein